MHKYIFLSVFAILLAGSCKTTQKNNPGDDKMPADFSVEYTYSAGMTGWTRQIKLTTGVGADAGKDKDGTFSYTFVPQGEALQELYAGLKKLDVFNMKWETRGRVYDRGGIKLLFVANGTTYIVDNSDSNFVLDEYVENFKAAAELIKTFAEKYRNQK